MPKGSTAHSSPLRFSPAERETGAAEAAFAAIYHEHHQPLYRYCLSILRHEHDAQDALQNTMIKAHAALADDDRELHMRPWLFRVAHNECISAMRRRRHTTELADDLPALSTTEQRHAEREELRQIERDLAELPERQRSALVLRELSGLSHDEIALVLSVTPAVVKSAIYEARSALLQYREGRDMACAAVRGALSDGDKRVLRGGRQRAHLRDCAGCRAFQTGLLARPAQLAAIAPPLPAAAAAAMLQHVLGGVGVGTAGSAAAFGVGSAGSVAATSVAPAAALGGSAAGAGATAAAAGTSIIGGLTAKVTATVVVAALAAGGTAAVKPAPRAERDSSGGAQPADASSSAKTAPKIAQAVGAIAARRNAAAAADKAGGAGTPAADGPGGTSTSAGSGAANRPQPETGTAPVKDRPAAGGGGSATTGATTSSNASGKPTGKPTRKPAAKPGSGNGSSKGQGKSATAPGATAPSGAGPATPTTGPRKPGASTNGGGANAPKPKLRPQTGATPGAPDAANADGANGAPDAANADGASGAPDAANADGANGAPPQPTDP